MLRKKKKQDQEESDAELITSIRLHYARSCVEVKAWEEAKTQVKFFGSGR
jgi:hypothetical protein